jgi:hypothetical protein
MLLPPPPTPFKFLECLAYGGKKIRIAFNRSCVYFVLRARIYEVFEEAYDFYVK